MEKDKKVPQAVIDLYSCISEMSIENFIESFGRYVNLLSTLSSKSFSKILRRFDRSGELSTLILDAKNHIFPYVNQPIKHTETSDSMLPLPFDGTQFPKFMITVSYMNSNLYPSTFKFMKKRDDGGPSHFRHNACEVIRLVQSFWTEKRKAELESYTKYT